MPQEPQAPLWLAVEQATDSWPVCIMSPQPGHLVLTMRWKHIFLVEFEGKWGLMLSEYEKVYGVSEQWLCLCVLADSSLCEWCRNPTVRVLY